MVKSKKNIIITLIILVMILSIIFILKIINYEKENNSEIDINSMSNEEKKQVISEIEKNIKDTTDNHILIINGESISEKEIAIIDFQLNNEYVSKNRDKKDAKDEVIRQYAILQNAKEININLTENEIETIEKNVNSYMQKDKEETKQLLNALNMEYNEFLKFYIDRTKKLEIISKWEIYIVNEINNENINIEDKEFNQEYNKYLDIKDIGEKSQSLRKLLELYEKYIQRKAKVEYK